MNSADSVVGTATPFLGDSGGAVSVAELSPPLERLDNDDLMAPLRRELTPCVTRGKVLSERLCESKRETLRAEPTGGASDASLALPDWDTSTLPQMLRAVVRKLCSEACWATKDGAISLNII
mmetsp:Transcript_9961/g.22282  ORF Transcript_9961/g.22282 Transcript_9961/m.22282 type:complete len:122 (-) Transcript_9961:314-679(-)